ncbi:hypothetical protein ADL26_19290 [Thermoactinomyces vulgaris]|nr:hypothetical protein ADL26_19290 [Thermoactinomyces vulgaris]
MADEDAVLAHGPDVELVLRVHLREDATEQRTVLLLGLGAVSHPLRDAGVLEQGDEVRFVRGPIRLEEQALGLQGWSHGRDAALGRVIGQPGFGRRSR